MALIQPLPRIFVQIVSYRDSECHWSIKDMFEKAAHPERVFVGLCWQYDPEEDQDCFPIDYPRPKQVRRVDFHIRDALGAGWARNQAQALYQGEEYILQIQAHIRFEPGWDDTLIDMLGRCPSGKPVLSAYLPPYMPPDVTPEERQLFQTNPLRIRIRRMGPPPDPQILHLTGIPVPAGDERAGLYQSPFWIGNFMFCRPELLDEVPNDPYIYFFGEELAYSSRLFTHGWDIFQPDRVVMYHQWDRRGTFSKQPYRRPGMDQNRLSLQRVRHLLGFRATRNQEALAEIKRYGLGRERQLEDLWEFAGIDWRERTVTQDARKGIWNMAALKKGSKKTAKKPAGARKPAKMAAASHLPRIFVQIASYRDPDCQHTVKDMFDKAAHPERIFAGICWQFLKGEDNAFFEVPYPRPDQVRVHEVDARKSKGVCWARGLTQKLWEGEEFTLQIDSHMRFEPGWDDLLIDMWKQCGSDKAVLTCYPPGFTPPHDLQRQWIFGMAAKHFDKNGILLMHGKPAFEVGKNEPERPVPGAFASACMYFGPSSLIEDVPYDPYLYFFGEEISLAVRFWTHGYDLYHPNRLVIFHDWDRTRRATHFSDHRDWGKLNALAQARVRHLLGVERSADPEVTRELDTYGLGKERTLAQYEAFSGVNFAAKSISEHALQGIFSGSAVSSPKLVVSHQPTAKDMKSRIFVQIASYRDRECQYTVKDLFEKASNPDRVFVGICWQFDPEEDKDCFQVSTRPGQVRILPVDWREAEGVCWARHQAQQLWEGEEYYLQIDSHMRFVPGWDDLMIAELAACGAQKPVISCSPASYVPPDELEKSPRPAIRRVQPFTPDGNIRGKGESLDVEPPVPLNGAFIAAGYVFARSDIIREVPYDPYLYFDQEEISYALRLYTHGWDVFSARKQFLYHFYNVNHRDKNRPLHWRDLHKEDSKRIAFLRDRGLKRFNHLTGHALSSDPAVIQEMGKYWLGRVRTLEQFEEYCGIDFKRKIAGEKALRCRFIRELDRYRTRPIHIPEIDGERKQAAVAVAAMPVATATRVAATMFPVQKAVAKPASAAPAMAMLELGDYVPLFEIEDTDRRKRAIEVYGGRHVMLYFLPAFDRDYLRTFFQRQQQQMNAQGKREIWQLFILDDTVDNLIALRDIIGTRHVLWADPERRLAYGFGVCKPGETRVPPTGFLLDNNLKVFGRHTGLDAAKLPAAMVSDVIKAVDAFKEKNRHPRIVNGLPPALIVPNVLTPELCQKLIHSFRTGHQYEGTVGAEDKKAYRPGTKMRTDHVPPAKLLAEIDEKLSRSFFPEIKKIFGFEVTHRELYKVGLYTGEKGGFFKQHRDNFDAPLGYRRVASTVHLNADYEGGGLNFPEYDRNIYRPDAGAGIAFSCATLHEALPVTKGERFVLVGFFHGEEDEAFRRHYLMGKNAPLKEKEFTPTLRRYDGIPMSRGFFANWRRENVRFSKEQPLEAIPAAQVLPLTSVPQPKVMINSIGIHKPKKVYESSAGVIFDDFVPEDVFQKLHAYAVKADYEHINTGKVSRAWHLHDHFPLRSSPTVFYYAEGREKPTNSTNYPSNTDVDLFIDHVRSMVPHAQHLVGKEGEWNHFSVTAWLYPQGTGLSMHDDGSNVYTGAYTYFMSPTWRPHWGGLLLLVEEEGNALVREHRQEIDQMDFYKRHWQHANRLDELLMEHGFARCIFPKRNRMVFIANDAYHMITRVTEAAGDNLRMSFAGFFDKKNK